MLSSVSFSSLARWVRARQLQLPYRRAWKDSTRTPKARKQRVTEGLEDGEKMEGFWGGAEAEGRCPALEGAPREAAVDLKAQGPGSMPGTPVCTHLFSVRWHLLKLLR